MKEKDRLKRKSKFLSLVLRHKPEVIGISMDEQGWVDVSELLEKLDANGRSMSMEELEEVVAKNDKKRFAFNEDHSRIRASQGHSLDLELGYSPSEPPNELYHGTATRFIDSIRKSGLEKRNRHHVHLSANLNTAKDVGGRHGKPVILIVKAKEMQEAGFKFFVSENAVWLTDNVPVDYIVFPE